MGDSDSSILQVPETPTRRGVSNLTIESPDGSNNSTAVAQTPQSHRSGVSHSTEASNIQMLDKLNRKYTFDTSVKISRFDCLKGIFMLNKMTRKVASTVEFNDMEAPSSENQERSPYIVTVQVLSNEKTDSTHYIPKVAQCSLDTGNHQGNMVSKEYLFTVLKYAQEDLLPLTESEQYGGTSASGHRVDPEAAVCLTWYHGKNARTFHDMRFLVCTSTSYDLVISERSIRKHNLLSRPNLAINEDGKHYLKKDSGEELKNLTGQAGRLENELESINEELDQAKLEGKKKKAANLELKILALEKKCTVANLEVEKYHAKNSMDLDPTVENQKHFASISNKLEEAMAALPGSKDPMSQTLPKISQPDGARSNGKEGGLMGFFGVKKSTKDQSKP